MKLTNQGDSQKFSNHLKRLSTTLVKNESTQALITALKGLIRIANNGESEAGEIQKLTSDYLKARHTSIARTQTLRQLDAYLRRVLTKLGQFNLIDKYKFSHRIGRSLHTPTVNSGDIIRQINEINLEPNPDALKTMLCDPQHTHLEIANKLLSSTISSLRQMEKIMSSVSISHLRSTSPATAELLESRVGRDNLLSELFIAYQGFTVEHDSHTLPFRNIEQTLTQCRLAEERYKKALEAVGNTPSSIINYTDVLRRKIQADQALLYAAGLQSPLKLKVA